ncbi:52 kDa repressor of the inhibitor of the protein kinase-like [Mytilus trossulus]|uniref:52 kDa repressor of the inhibitor of the protein kinase-like n=1 Tax=Mytilus trossulus TaxID=6551 RepID=UPI003005F349
MRPESRIYINTNARGDTFIAKNRQILKSLIKCLEFCGRRGLALRGHRDDDKIQDNTQDYNIGNYKELVKFRAEAGDSVLDDHLKQCAKNASYTSKTSQNELLACIKRFIQQTIVDEVKAQPLGPHFGYQCDEVSDASNWEQLGIVIRYLRDGSPVEKLLEFVQAEETTDSALCGLIVKALTDAGLDIQFGRAQTMDGAGNMSGKNLGCAAQFTRLSPRTVYHYCASHNLNLVLCKCCNVPEIQLMLDSLKQLGIFFKYSPKRSRCLEKAVDEINSNRDVQNKITKQKFKVFCETRWCEKITTLGSFSTMYEPIISCLEEISSNVGRTWDKKAVIDAKGLLTKITDSTFIVSFQTVHNFFGYVTGLSRKLQGSTLDIVEGYKMIDTVKALVKSTRDDETEFDNVFEKATAMAEVADIGGIKAPRRCGRQTQRSNVPADNVQVYYRRAVFLPFLDSMIQQFEIRFGERAVSVVRALALIPNNIHQTTDEAIDDIINYYEVDMPFPDSFRQEFRLWKELWRVQNEKPTTLTSTLTDPRMNRAVTVDALMFDKEASVTTDTQTSCSQESLTDYSQSSCQKEESIYYLNKFLELNRSKPVSCLPTKRWTDYSSKSKNMYVNQIQLITDSVIEFVFPFDTDEVKTSLSLDVPSNR